MYVYKRQATVYQGIATLVTLALVLWALGVHMFAQTAEAANLTYVSNTLSDSAPSSASNHEISFLSPTGVGNSETITVTFPSEFTGTSSITVADVDFEINGTDETLVAGAPGAGQWGFSWSGDVMTLTAANDESLASNATATIKIGTNADGPGVNQITNPSATTSYEFTITAGPSDTGQTRVAIIENVLVTADVNTTLTFTVTGTSSGISINGSATSTFGASTNTTLPFGTLEPNVRKLLGQDLTVATNAIHGYVVTVEQDTQLQSANGAVIDDFIDNSATTTPVSWVSPSNNIIDPTTWGHWGLTSTDGTTTRIATEEFSSDTWVAASTTPIVVMSHDSVADGTTAGIGYAAVGYQVEITALQEAGDDYQTTLTYIATPTF